MTCKQHVGQTDACAPTWGRCALSRMFVRGSGLVSARSGVAAARPSCAYAELPQSVRGLWRDKKKPQADFGPRRLSIFTPSRLLQPSGNVPRSQRAKRLFREGRKLLKGGRTMAVREELRKRKLFASIVVLTPPRDAKLRREGHKKICDDVAARLFRASGLLQW